MTLLLIALASLDFSCTCLLMSRCVQVQGRLLFLCELILALPQGLTAGFVITYGIRLVKRIEEEGNAEDARLQAAAKKISRVTCVLGILFLATTIGAIVAAVDHLRGSALFTSVQYSWLFSAQCLVTSVSFLIILFYKSELQLKLGWMSDFESDIRTSFASFTRSFRCKTPQLLATEPQHTQESPICDQTTARLGVC